MSTTIEDAVGLLEDPAADSACRVAVFYDETAARERAVGLANHLVRHFWEVLDLSFSWWRLRYLGEPAIAETAALAAQFSDVLVFSVDAASHPDAATLVWMDRWVPQRGKDAGAIVPLLHPATPDAISESPWMVQIEAIARESGLECLLPPALKGSPLFAENFRRVQRQVHHVGGIMDAILHRPTGGGAPPSHWGLNE